MPRKLKRAALALTEESCRQLEILMHRFGETRSEVMKRAITLLWFNSLNEKIDKITEEK